MAKTRIRKRWRKEDRAEICFESIICRLADELVVESEE